MENIRSIEEREKALALAQKRLDDEKEQLAEAKAQHARGGWRDNLYGRITVSVRTMDKFIVGVSVLLFAAIVVGIVL